MRVKAHAKVNLGLSVLAERGDRFHEVDTLMVRSGLHDVLTLEPTSEGVGLEITGADLPMGKGNLAHRAAQMYLDAAGVSGGVSVRLEKRIPVAAGLGGGSSDAGAVLRGLGALYPAEVDLLELAKALGSDVPFFVQDLPAARAQGRGERLTPVEVPPLHLVLVNPGVAVSARDAYANLQGFSSSLALGSLLKSLSGGEEPSYANALQAGVLKHHSVIREVLAALREAGLRGVLMSGSGSTCFGLARDEAHAREVADGLQAAHPAWWVHATRTL